MSSKLKTTATKENGKPGLLPHLRFPEFREAEGWKLVTLQEASAPVAERVGQRKLTPVSISAGIGFVPQSKKFGRDISGNQYQLYTLVRDGDFVFNKGNSLKFPQGCVYLLQGWGQVAAPNVFICFRLKNGYSNGFFQNCFEQNQHGRQLKKHITSGARSNGLLNISKDTFFGVEIPTPALPEQQKIAKCLSSVDELIAAQEWKLDALKTHKKGLMQQLFPREGETQPRLRFPEFQNAGEWVVKRVDEQGSVLAGKALAVNASGPLRPYLRTKNVLDGAIDVSDVLTMPMTDAEFNRFEVLDGDILLNEGQSLGLVGRASIYRGEFGQRCAMQNALLRFRAFPSTCPEFAAQAFRQCQKDRTFASIATQTTSVAHLGSSRFSALEMAWPPTVAEQQRIATCLSSLDALITAETQKLEILKTHKKGLMQQLFPETGASQVLSVKTAIVNVAITSKSAEPEETLSQKPYKIGFARQLLAAEILQHCHQHPTMGRVKLQKIIHLCEYHAELDDIHGNYVRAAAGPFDNKLMRGVANGLEKQEWFKQVRGEKRTSYEPMVSSGQHAKYLQRWSKQLPKIREIIKHFLKARTLSCEIASTLYAAWNDLLIEGRKPTDEEIIREASDPKRWHESKANIDEIKWPAALNWMREKGLVPRGYGAHTTR